MVIQIEGFYWHWERSVWCGKLAPQWDQCGPEIYSDRITCVSEPGRCVYSRADMEVYSTRKKQALRSSAWVKYASSLILKDCCDDH